MMLSPNDFCVPFRCEILATVRFALDSPGPWSTACHRAINHRSLQMTTPGIINLGNKTSGIIARPNFCGLGQLFPKVNIQYYISSGQYFPIQDRNVSPHGLAKILWGKRVCPNVLTPQTFYGPRTRNTECEDARQQAVPPYPRPKPPPKPLPSPCRRLRPPPPGAVQ